MSRITRRFDKVLYDLLYDHTDGTIWMEGAQCASPPVYASLLLQITEPAKRSDSL